MRLPCMGQLFVSAFEPMRGNSYSWMRDAYQHPSHRPLQEFAMAFIELYAELIPRHLKSSGRVWGVGRSSYRSPV